MEELIELIINVGILAFVIWALFAFLPLWLAITLLIIILLK